MEKGGSGHETITWGGRGDVSPPMQSVEVLAKFLSKECKSGFYYLTLGACTVGYGSHSVYLATTYLVYVGSLWCYRCVAFIENAVQKFLLTMIAFLTS